MDINQVTVTGRIMNNVTKRADKDGVVIKLGTIGIYKGKDKQTGEPLYANIPFMAYNTATEFIKPNTKMMLVVQLQVNSAYPIATSQDVNVSDAF
ncbi:hypothetical protein Nizo2535_1272 [Lactiplantibacillus plantarum]|uniref:hypothetical protein n=1 Tax=Lactiplantibacillus plantarum TaxID=1590 RepID=UPI0007B55170|nr:hypothetical protein [Lactiplantibacillus plantarum]KZU32883.1 hypothetical protein Nizo2535_1272 [Lactiplantibacillus plantarum]KZU78417.1 hypothetical protein Nizo2891_1792 [Lactiplantibacillus plantarum]